MSPDTPQMTDDDILDQAGEERTPCEVWTRVMGYHRPVAAFNAGKRSEHRQRRYFCEPGSDPVAASA